MIQFKFISAYDHCVIPEKIPVKNFSLQTKVFFLNHVRHKKFVQKCIVNDGCFKFSH